MGRRLSGNGGGGALRAKTINAKVPLVTGLLTTVSSFGLLAPVTFARTGGNANLALASNGQISATAALAAGTTQSINGTATGADGVVLPFTANLTGQPTLGTLALSATTANTASSVTINITGSVLGSTISGAVPPGMTLSSVNRTISGTPTATGTFDFDLVETLAGAFGSPKTTRVSIVVTAVPTMEMGIGLTGLAGYNGYYPFANIMWNGGAYEKVSGTGAWSSDLGTIDAAVSTDTFRNKLAEGSFALSCLPEGTYTVLNPDGCEVGIGPYGSPTNTGWTRATQFTFDWNASMISQGTLTLHVRGSLTNINGPLRVIMPGHLASFNAGNPWSSVYLSFISGAKPRVLRFMDWLQTMFDLSESVSDDRVTTNAITFSASQFRAARKIPYELCIDLCNRVNAGLWLNIPARASNGFVDSVVNKVAAGLNPGLPVYVEYGNEIWNPGFGYADARRWVDLINNTRYEATPDGTNTWTLAEHPFTTGQLVSGLATRESFANGSYSPAWQYLTGSDLTVEKLTANTFRLWYGPVTTGTLLPAPAAHGKLILKSTSEAGKTTGVDTNYGIRSAEIWSRVDAILGRSRVKHVLGTQLGWLTVTQNRIANPSVFAATDMVATALYYDGEWFVEAVDIASGQITPRVWSYNGPRTHRCAIYAAGSTPTIAEVLAGGGTGFIAAQDIVHATGSGSAGQPFTAGTAFTGLTNGTTYKVCFVYTDGDGDKWMAQGNATVSTTPSTVTFDDGDANMARRANKSVNYWLTQTAAHQAAAPGKEFVAYEAGSDYFGGNTSIPEIVAWRARYTQSPEAVSVFSNMYRSMAAQGYTLVNQFTDMGATPGVFNMAESLTDTADGRYQFFAAQNGRIAKGALLSIADSTLPNITTEPTYPYTVAVLGSASNTYSIYSGDLNNNYAIVGNELRLVNGYGINWSVPTTRNLRIQASNGSSSCLFRVNFATGNAWYVPDAMFAWSSVTDTDTAQVNPQIGPAMNRLVGTADAVASGGLWTFDGTKAYGLQGAAMGAASPSFTTPLFIAVVVDRNGSTASGKMHATFFNSNLLYLEQGFSNSDRMRWRGWAAGAIPSAYVSNTAITGPHVNWLYYNGAGVWQAGYDQVVNTTSGTSSYTPPAGSFGSSTRTDVIIGADTTLGGLSPCKIGSAQVVSRAGMTLSDALAMVAKMQTHHGIP